MARKRRQHKSGSIREKAGRLYIRYFDQAGKRVEEAAGIDRKAAERLLQQRIGEVAAGTPPKFKAGADITIEDCLRLAIRELERLNKPSAKLYEYQIKTAFDTIGQKKACRFSYQDAWAFIEWRRSEGKKESTINRDLCQLRSALRLAADERFKLIPAAPKIPHLDPGDNVRTGFLTPKQYTALMENLPDYLRPITCFAYYTGLRKRKLMDLRLADVDVVERLIWVSRTKQKNKKSHTVPILDGDMLRFAVEALERNKVYLFEQANGRPFSDFRHAWVTAVKLAGMPKLTFHDLRRTAVKDWIATGAPTSTVMAISGHKTAKMLERYNIIDAAVVQQAARFRNHQIASAEIPAAEVIENGEQVGKDSQIRPS